MRTISKDRFEDYVKAEVYMRSIMEHLGVATPAAALAKVKGYKPCAICQPVGGIMKYSEKRLAERN